MKNYIVTINWATLNGNLKTYIERIHLASTEDHAFEVALAKLKLAKKKHFSKWLDADVMEVREQDVIPARPKHSEFDVLCARVMGFRLQDNPEERWCGHWFVDQPSEIFNGRLEVLHFSTDWNWIQEVIKKVSGLGYSIESKSEYNQFHDKAFCLVRAYKRVGELSKDKSTIYNSTNVFEYDSGFMGDLMSATRIVLLNVLKHYLGE